MKKLNKGSRLDELPPDIPEGAWGRAKNIVNYKKFGGISNENGADNITPIAVPATQYQNFPTKPVNGVIRIEKGSVFFFAPSVVGNDSEIGIVDKDNRYTPILRDIAGRVVLDLDINSPVQGTYEYKFNNNLIIAFRDSKNNPRILNTDCLPFTLDANYNVVIGDLAKAKALIKLFPDVLTPDIDDLYLTDNGGNLKTGSYYPIVSYELADKSTTSWLRVYNPFPVTQDSSTIPFIENDGDFADTPTSKKLHIKFINLDTNYLNLKFGVIILKAGVYTPYHIGTYRISGGTLEFDYTGSESSITPITLDEVLIPNAVYTKAGTITNLLGKLYLGDVEKRQQINLQQYANMINVDWVRGDDITLIDNHNESYKDEKIVFFNKSFRSDETYALYVAGKYKDGTYTDAFHIPGRAPLTGDTAVISGTGDAEVDILGADVKKFQVRETALLDGTMGYWENETEFYPNTDDFNSLSLGGLDLRGLPVRHHKFPEIATIVRGGEYYFKKFNADAGSIVLNNPVTFDATPYVGFSSYEYNLVSDTQADTAFTVPGFFDFNEVTNSAINKVIRISGNIVFSITGIQPAGPGSTVSIDAFIRNNAGSGALNETLTVTYAMTNGTGNYTGTLPFNKYWGLFAIADRMNVQLLAAINDPAVAISFTGTQLTIEAGTFEAASKPLGIRISNFNIPTVIADQLDSWEIFYAKRDNSNVRVIGQDVSKEDRLHTFDLVYNQANLRADYVKPQLLFFKDSLTATSPLYADYINTTSFEFVTDGIVDDIKALTKFYYVGENTLSPINNTNKSTSIYVEPELNTLDILYGNILLDLHIYRKDVYKTFDAQTLISTGRAFKITAGGLQASQDIYGGDTFISAFGFLEDTVNKNEYLIPQESAANIGLRMDDEIQSPSKYYFPKHTKTDGNPIDPTISFYGYNNDYTALNDLNKVYPKTLYFDNCIADIYAFPYLIPFSITDANESLKLNWRIFKINDYYDALPKDKGKIWNLLGSNRTLYIQQEYALLIAEVKDSLEGSGTATIALGISDIFERPPIEILPTDEGYVGSQCQFATVMTPMGYVTIDRQQGKVFVFDKGQGLQEISNQGYYNFFKQYTQTTNKDIDNPFIGNGFMVAYDLEFRRLMVVKKDAQYEFTLSYCHDTKQWLGAHDYHPNYMFSTRNGLYAGVNTNFKLYKHNSKTLKGIFYDGVMYDSYIDVPFNQGQDVTKVFSNFNWITHVQALDGTMKDNETLSHIMVYNNNQCSGKVNLKADNALWFGKDARNTEETWNFNNFRDVLKDRNLVFLDAYGELITTNINNNKAWFEKSKFITKFVIVRFIYDNVTQRDVHIVSVDSNMRKSNR